VRLIENKAERKTKVKSKKEPEKKAA